MLYNIGVLVLDAGIYHGLGETEYWDSESCVRQYMQSLEPGF